MKNKIINYIFIVLFFFFATMQVVYAQTQYVSVLTWWGYLDNSWISEMVDSECGVKLSYDSYNSNEELIRRWNEGKSKYDVLIFSNTIYSALKKEIILKNSKLYRNAEHYHPVIRQQYEKSHFPRNVAYFLHSLTGFIWNPRIINLVDTDNVVGVFQKAKSNMTVIIDDPLETQMLLFSEDSSLVDKNSILTYHKFKKITQNSKVFISNQLNQVYDQDNFAFAYQWSGIAIAELIKQPKYKFLINKNLSYVSTDLIAQLQDNKPAACVANLFSSKKFLSKMQNDAYYFSPYGNADNISNAQFRAIYKDFLTQISKLSWIRPISLSQLKELNHQWDITKYELSK